MPVPWREIPRARPTTPDVVMSPNDCLIALFGRPVWLRCKLCHRVNPVTEEESSETRWLEERVAMEAHGVSPADLWWFQTVCACCQRAQKEEHPVR